MESHGVSQRRACKIIGQPRMTQRYTEKPNPQKEKLRARVIELATEYGRYGYRQITSMLNNEGWKVGRDAVYTIWREEGLQVPQKQPKKKGFGWLTGPVSASDHCIPITSGHTTLFTTALMTAKRLKF